MKIETMIKFAVIVPPRENAGCAADADGAAGGRRVKEAEILEFPRWK